MKNIAVIKKKNDKYIIIALTVLLLATAFISMVIGRFGIPVKQIIITITDFVNGKITMQDNQSAAVLFAIRIPRICLAVLAGAALAASGAAYQGLFKNPMVSPDILGVSSGASIGASIAILFSFPGYQIQLMAFASGLLAVFMVLAISNAVVRGNGNLLIMVLAGTVISALCSAFTSLLKYVADTDTKLPEITFWLMGSFAKTGGWRNVIILFVAAAAGTVPLFMLRFKINVMSFGEEEAQAMGVNTRQTRMIIIFCATLLTASTVAICGTIGWVGLIIPHICRFLVGANYISLLPASMLAGGTFMLVVDNVARSVTSGEIPLGILTAIIGAPLFIYLLFRGRRGWSS